MNRHLFMCPQEISYHSKHGFTQIGMLPPQGTRERWTQWIVFSEQLLLANGMPLPGGGLVLLSHSSVWISTSRAPVGNTPLFPTCCHVFLNSTLSFPSSDKAIVCFPKSLHVWGKKKFWQVLEGFWNSSCYIDGKYCSVLLLQGSIEVLLPLDALWCLVFTGEQGLG